MVQGEGKLPVAPLAGKMKLTLLSPTPAEGYARAMQGLLSRATERALGHARGIALRSGDDAAVPTEAAARALG